MTPFFDKIYNLIAESQKIILEKNDLKYAETLDLSRIKDFLFKNSNTPFVQSFYSEVVKDWNRYHLMPKFTLIERTKKSQHRVWSFEFGTKREGYRGFGIQQERNFVVLAIFSNHRDYDKAIMKL
jgi:hypothetical protein